MKKKKKFTKVSFANLERNEAELLGKKKNINKTPKQGLIRIREDLKWPQNVKEKLDKNRIFEIRLVFKIDQQCFPKLLILS